MEAASSSQSREKEGHVVDFTASLCCAVAVSLLQWQCCLLITAVGSCVSLECSVFLRRCGPVGWTLEEGSGNDHKV